VAKDIAVLPLLHAGGFSWDEALVLIVAIAAVPALTWFTGRLGRRKDRERDDGVRSEE
jgi:hypothetical protein